MNAVAEKPKKKRTEKKLPAAEKPRKPRKVQILDTELDPLREADEILRKIEEAEAACDEQMIRVEQARDNLKLVKGTYAKAVLDLRRLCRIRKEQHPLFDQAEKKPTEGQQAAQGETAGAVDKDGWKALPLDAAGINGNTARLLIEAGHDTLGKLSNLMNAHGQWWPKEVRGIGEAGAADVADRFADFWTTHPEFCQ